MRKAISYLLKGFQLLMSPALRPYILMPLLVNLILYSVTLILGYFYLNHLVTQIIPISLQWISWLIYPLFFIGFCFIGFFTFSLLANLIAAPFYAKLAAKTRIITNIPIIDVVEPTLTQVWQAEFKRIRYFIMRTFPLLILFIIPVVNLIAPILWLGFSSWCTALEYFAYAQENRGVLFPQQQVELKKIKVQALSFGVLVTLGQTLPIFNIIIAPVAVIAATLQVHAKIEND